uniref:NADH-ubiquinone oxidoreductase chain 1 n=2 Tax=Eukaryota TaxID=2759 RepID=A0A0C4K5K0_9HEXA|nr:NADH dehydrogenase subunit 1 [Acerella muscorum]AHL42966.1 NADH dehydrogenase subunit 1 [Acerella muscorum]
MNNFIKIKFKLKLNVYMMFFSLMMFFFMIMMILVGVAFLTLFERKILSYIQFRKGPNKMLFMGNFQPFSDAIKLMTKEFTMLIFGNYFIFLIVPFMSLTISMLIWLVSPMMFNNLDFNMSAMFFLCCVALGIYSLMGSGWSSNSKYSYLGSIRSVAQSISYEVSLALIMMNYLLLSLSLGFNFLNEYQLGFWFLFLMIPISMMWMLSFLAEINRSPFDFSEGESELVSGFNIEYSSMQFGVIFMSEYMMMMFMSYLTSILMLGNNFSMKFYLMVFLMNLFILWVRGSFPRFRYDYLMELCWKIFLPLILFILIFINMIIIYFK